MDLKKLDYSIPNIWLFKVFSFSEKFEKFFEEQKTGRLKFARQEFWIKHNFNVIHSLGRFVKKVDFVCIC